LAMTLPGKALPVALVIWLWSGMRRGAPIRLSARHIFPGIGISRFAVYRALEMLAQAGLIAVERHRGRPPLVTILTETQTARQEPGWTTSARSLRTPTRSARG